MLDKLNKEIAELSNHALNGIFDSQTHDDNWFIKSIERIKQLTRLRELYFQRANLHRDNDDFTMAAHDYYLSAQMGHSASMNLFSVFDADFIEDCFNSEPPPENMSKETAFTNFIQYSTGIGEEKNQWLALKNFVYSVKLNHPETEYLNQKLYNILFCLRFPSASKSALTRANYDQGESAIGTYHLIHGNDILAFKCFSKSVQLGTGAAFKGFGTIYFNGLSIPRNTKLGLLYYTLAVETGRFESLPPEAYQSFVKFAAANPDEFISFLDLISHSRLITLIEFHKNVLLLTKDSGFTWFCSSEPVVSVRVKNKLLEILALCEITQSPHNPESGLNSMRKITDLSDCSPTICQRLVSFHSNHIARKNIDSKLSGIIARFEEVASKQLNIHLEGGITAGMV